MILVKTILKKSKTHGVGLYADEFIPKGTVTWKYVPWFDISYSDNDLKKMSKHARNQVIWYGYFDKKSKKHILCSDDQRFINHSHNPKKINIQSTPSKDVAKKNIKIGEELLCDYNKFDSTYFDRMGIDRKKLR